MEDLIHNSEKRDAVSGNLLVTTELNGKSVTAPAVMLVEYPDRLRLELQDPVGGILALLVVNGDRFWLYQHDKPEILTGLVSRAPAVVPTVDLAHITRFFLARPDPDRLRRSILTDDSATYVPVQLKSAGDADADVVRWKGSLAEPTVWEHRSSAKGHAVFTAEYDDYEFKEGLRYPTKIRVTRADPGLDKREVLLVWKDWDPSVPKEKKLFQIPQPETFGRKIKVLH